MGHELSRKNIALCTGLYGKSAIVRMTPVVLSSIKIPHRNVTRPTNLARQLLTLGLYDSHLRLFSARGLRVVKYEYCDILTYVTGWWWPHAAQHCCLRQHHDFCEIKLPDYCVRYVLDDELRMWRLHLGINGSEEVTFCLINKHMNHYVHCLLGAYYNTWIFA